MAPHQGVGQLAVWHHSPSNAAKAKARVLIIHGLSEHSGRHLNTVQALADAGYEVIRFDLRGSGESGGRRQWIEKFSDYVDDVSAICRWIQRDRDPLPLFILGHSLGGAVAIHFASVYQKALQGLILSAPAYLTGQAISPLLIAVGRRLVKVFPTFRVKGTGNKNAVSRDTAAVEAYLNDPLCCHTNTLNQGNEILSALEKNPSLCGQIEIPTLFVHGTDDQIIRVEGSFELLKCLSSADKELAIRPGGYHESHNDLGKEEYFTALVQWLNRHV